MAVVISWHTTALRGITVEKDSCALAVPARLLPFVVAAAFCPPLPHIKMTSHLFFLLKVGDFVVVEMASFLPRMGHAT